MKGHVDELGRALLRFKLLQKETGETTMLDGWIDTAFNGELVIPKSMIQSASLRQTSGCLSRLADGKTVTLPVFECEIDWMGTRQLVEIVANDGELPLIGVGLLIGCKLTIDYRNGDVELSR